MRLRTKEMPRAGTAKINRDRETLIIQNLITFRPDYSYSASQYFFISAHG